MSELKLLRGRERDIGFMVRRLLPTLEFPSVGPFVFLDHMGPAQFAAGSTENDVRPHPHIGLATVTFLYSGAFMHRDSLGVVQRIEPGAVNWMSAGSGVVHSERIPEDVRAAGMPVEGIQMWLALPREQEQSAPYFRHYAASELPQWQTAGVQVRILIGEVNGQRSPVQTPAATVFADIAFSAAAQCQIDADYAERALYVSQGTMQINDQQVSAGQLAILPASGPVKLATTSAARAMLLGGAPLDGKRFLWWNFVASDRERIEAAKQRWRDQQFGVVAGETEFIPLPER